MSDNYRQIFFIFVKQKNIEDIQIENIDSFNSEMKKIKKVYNCEIDKKNAELYSICFKYLTKHNIFNLLFLDKNKNKLYTSENIKFIKDKNNFIYNFKIYEDTSTITKLVTMGFYQSKELEYFKLKKSDQFKIFINYIDKEFGKIINPDNQKDNLITQTINLMLKEEEKISFSLYLIIFREIFRFPKVTSLLRAYKIDKFSFDEKVKDPNKFSFLLKTILKKPDYFDQYFNNKLQVKNICMGNFYLFILSFYYHYEAEYIEELISEKQKNNLDNDLIKKLNDRANKMKELLKSNSKYFPNLPEKIKSIVNKRNISNIKNIDDLIILINGKMKVEEKLRIILEKVNYININKKKIYIRINNTEISNNDNIDNIIKLFESLINIGKEKSFFLLDFDPEIWKKYVGFYVQSKNINNIYKIKMCVSKDN